MNGNKSLIAVLAAVMTVASADMNLSWAQTKAKTAGQDTTAVAEENPLDFEREEMRYESSGKRDPFGSLVPATSEDAKTIKGMLDYDGAILKGIVRTGDDIYALVMADGGSSYVLREGYKVFGGYVTSITDDALHLHIVKYGRSLSIIMRLEASKTTVVEESVAGDSLIKKPGITVQYNQNAQESVTIAVEDVIVPSLTTKTVEELWFGQGGETVDDSANTTDEKPAPAMFTLIDPPKDSWVTLPYAFDWTSLDGEGLTYAVIVDDDPDYTSPLLVKSGIKTSSWLLLEGSDLPTDTLLYWKVTAQDDSGVRGVCRRLDMTFKIR